VVAQACIPPAVYEGSFFPTSSPTLILFLKPALANSSQDPICKKTSQKRAGGVYQGVGPDFSPSIEKNKKKTKCSTSVTIKEMQIKTSLRVNLTPVRMPIIQKTSNIK
jgi:hypothetical protein